jgi:hypothetical protein
MEGLTLVGVFMEGTTLTCLETYFDAKKRTLVKITNFRDMDDFHPPLYCSL